MRLKKEIYNSIISDFPNTAIETGGILGGSFDVITEYILDSGKGEYGKYTPNTKMINKIIFDWSGKGINFHGICHSHYPIGEKLSLADIEYIKRIMVSVSDVYDYLYFPIVIPKKKIIPFKVEITNDNILISNDKLFLID